MFRAVAMEQGNTQSLWRLLAVGMVPRLFLTGALLHPSIAHLVGPMETTGPSAETVRAQARARASLLLLPLLTGPALLIVMDSRIGPGGRFAAIGSSAVAVLVVARLAKLNHEVSTGGERKERQDRWFESVAQGYYFSTPKPVDEFELALMAPAALDGVVLAEVARPHSLRGG